MRSPVVRYLQVSVLAKRRRQWKGLVFIEHWMPQDRKPRLYLNLSVADTRHWVGNPTYGIVADLQGREEVRWPKSESARRQGAEE
jgi:hypothetical protein